MKLNAINAQPNVRKSDNNNLRAAKNGALLTAGALCASTGLSWATNKPAMQNVVRECGGKGKYAANFALGLGIFSTAGAIANTAFNSILHKINPQKSPKAAN